MANHKSALKRMRQDEVKRQRNRSHRTRMRNAVRKLRTLIEAGDADAAREQLPQILSLVDHTAQKGVIHRNTAARYKSRLTVAVAGIAA